MLGNPWIEVSLLKKKGEKKNKKATRPVYFFLLDDVHQLHNVRLVLHPQATSCTALELPTSSEILQVILEYIYTDESPTIRGKIIFSR